MKRLEGHVIREFTLDEGGYNLVVVTDTHRFTYRAEGDCCAHAYILSPDKADVESIIGHRVIQVESSDFTSVEDEYETVDTEFISIKTQFADLDLEMRTEHNGYYGGWVQFVSEETLG